MTSHLNALARRLLSAEGAAHAVVGPDAAHHVVDPDDLLGIDPLHALELQPALAALAAREPDGWVLGLPSPGALGPLRGPRELNEAALESGEVVVALSAGIALVPHRVGPAVQWRVHRAAVPFPPTGGGDAERELNETVLSAAAVLAGLDVAAGVRPGGSGTREPAARLGPGYPQRRQVAADRAARLLEACAVALADDGAAITSFEVDTRRRELIRLQQAARGALSAAVSWPGPPAEAK